VTVLITEAEAIYALEHWPGIKGEVLVTDDRPAAVTAAYRVSYPPANGDATVPRNCHQREYGARLGER
jgi:hypothetical protein